MKAFVAGKQDRILVESTLDNLKNDFGLSKLCGSAYSQCMEHVIDWAKRNKIPISLHMPEFEGDYPSTQDMMVSNISIIKTEKPLVVMVYDEDADVMSHLIEESKDSDYVEIFLSKDSL